MTTCPRLDEMGSKHNLSRYAPAVSISSLQKATILIVNSDWTFVRPKNPFDFLTMSSFITCSSLWITVSRWEVAQNPAPMAQSWGRGRKEQREGGRGRQMSKKLLNFHELYWVQLIYNTYDITMNHHHHSMHHYEITLKIITITLTSSCTIVTSIWLHHYCDITAKSRYSVN